MTLRAELKSIQERRAALATALVAPITSPSAKIAGILSLQQVANGILETEEAKAASEFFTPEIFVRQFRKNVKLKTARILAKALEEKSLPDVTQAVTDSADKDTLAYLASDFERSLDIDEDIAAQTRANERDLAVVATIKTKLAQTLLAAAREYYETQVKPVYARPRVLDAQIVAARSAFHTAFSSVATIALSVELHNVLRPEHLVAVDQGEKSLDDLLFAMTTLMQHPDLQVSRIAKFHYDALLAQSAEEKSQNTMATYLMCDDRTMPAARNTVIHRYFAEMKPVGNVIVERIGKFPGRIDGLRKLKTAHTAAIELLKSNTTDQERKVAELNEQIAVAEVDLAQAKRELTQYIVASRTDTLALEAKLVPIQVGLDAVPLEKAAIVALEAKINAACDRVAPDEKLAQLTTVAAEVGADIAAVEARWARCAAVATQLIAVHNERLALVALYGATARLRAVKADVKAKAAAHRELDIDQVTIDASLARLRARKALIDAKVQAARAALALPQVMDAPANALPVIAPHVADLRQEDARQADPQDAEAVDDAAPLLPPNRSPRADLAALAAARQVDPTEPETEEHRVTVRLYMASTFVYYDHLRDAIRKHVHEYAEAAKSAGRGDRSSYMIIRATIALLPVTASSDQVADALMKLYEANDDPHKLGILRGLLEADKKELLKDALDKYRIVCDLKRGLERTVPAPVKIAAFHNQLGQGDTKALLTKRRDTGFTSFVKGCGMTVAGILGLSVVFLPLTVYAYNSIYGKRATDGKVYINEVDAARTRSRGLVAGG